MGVGQSELIGQVKKLLDGSLMIPSIQRDYVWSRAQIPRLLDSLYKGYPVGSLLIWETNIDVPLKEASVVRTEHTQAKAGILLDGQQRLTSLAWVYKPDSVPVGKSKIDVRFDIRTETFHNPSATQKRDPFMVRVADVLTEGAQYASILEGVGVAQSDPEYQTYYERLSRLHGIRNYPMPIQTYASDDYEEVAEIFARVNTGGRRLSKGDLAMSAIAARWDEGLDRIKTLEESLAQIDFPIDREAILRLLALHAGVGADSIRLLKPEMTSDHLKTAWEATEHSLLLAVDFVKSAAGIPKSGLLTSPNVMLIPAYLLHQRGQKLEQGEQEQMVRWLLTAMAFSHYSNQVESKLEAEAKAVRELSPGDLWPELIRRASGPRSADSSISPVDLVDKTHRSPLFNLLYIAALRRGAKDWWNNLTLSGVPVGRGHKIEFHHVFPQALTKGRYPDSLRNSMANLAFLSGLGNKKVGAKDPKEYLAGVDGQELRNQWVPLDPSLWDVERFEEFLEARRRLMAADLNEMLGLPPYQEAPAPSQPLEDVDFDPTELDEGSAPVTDEEDLWAD